MAMIGSVDVPFTNSTQLANNAQQAADVANNTANIAIMTANGKNTAYFGATEPTDPQSGDIWFVEDSNGNVIAIKHYDGSKWVTDVDNASLAQQISDAQSAAENATEVGQTAQQMAEDVQTAVNQAQADAANAINQANNAVNTANQATQDAQNAIDKAQQGFDAAQDAINEANSANNTASTAATNASTALSNAQTALTNAASALSAYDNLQIGGRNLLKNSRLDYIPDGYLDTTTVKEIVNDAVHGNVLHVKAQYVYQVGYLYAINDGFKVNDQITVSFFAKSLSGVGLRFQLNTRTSTYTNTKEINIGTNWDYYSITIPIVALPTDGNGLMNLYIYPDNDEYWIRAVKVEKGNKATDWTPAPEDMATVVQFNTLSQTVDSTVLRIGNAEGNISALQQTASSFATSISNAEGDISTLQQTADNITTAMTTAQGDISTLQQTADSLTTSISAANGSISTLQQTADSFVTRISDAEGNISTLTQTTSGLQTTVSGKVDASTYNSFVTQTNSALQSKLNATDAANTYATQSSLTQTASSLQSTIDGKVDEDTYDSQISQLSSDINLRVQKNDVVNQINLSTESILIAGNKVHITGQTTIDNAIITSAMISSVNASTITTGTLDAARIAAGTIDASKLVAGSISATQIAAGAVTASKLSISDLSAISANLGTVTAGTITGVTINASDFNASGSIGRVKISGDGWYVMDSRGVRRVAIAIASTDWSSGSPSSINFFDYNGYQIGYVGIGGDSTNHNMQLNNAYDLTLTCGGTLKLSGANGISVLNNINNDINMSSHSLYKVYSLYSTFLYGNAVDINGGTHLYIRPSSSGEVRCTATGSTTTYVPLHASNVSTSSLAEYKQDVVLWGGSAIDIINSSDIYQYRLKADVANNRDKLEYGLVIGDGYRTPIEVLNYDRDGVEQYAMNSISWKAIQELSVEDTSNKERLSTLEEQNQNLILKVANLELRLAQLEAA